MKTELKNFVEQNPYSYFSMIKKNKLYKHLYDFIYEKTQQLIDDNEFKYSLQTRIYWILHDIKDFPICPICGKQYGIKTNISLKYGYPPTCKSKKCRYTNALNKTQATNMDRYGCKCSLANKEVQEKSKKTLLRDYGVDHPMKSKEIKDRIVHTCLTNYGVTNYTKTEEYVKRTKQTKKDRYGNENFVNVEKTKKTKQEKYGSSTYNNSTQARETCLDRYGVENYTKSNQFKEQLKTTRRKQLILHILENEYVDILDEMNEYTDLTKPVHCRCKKCKKEFISVLNNNSFYRHGIPFVCKHCFPKLNGTSHLEKEIQDFIKSLNVDIQVNDKSIISPFELDIYIPNKKIAIEFDGLYWHSCNEKQNKNYHLQKTQLCEDNGIQLIHIFENEWLYKQDIVKSRIKNILGMYDKVIYARKCSVKKIDYKSSMQFQNKHHLQGAIGANIHLGLFFDNELVSVMTFGKSRFNKKIEWEMLRFCSSMNYHVIGAAGKMLKFFEKMMNPSSIITYADRRWSIGKLYKSLGFTLKSISAPNYWYWKYTNEGCIFENRLKYQKHKLKNFLEKYDENLSECQNMKNNKFNKIYDCGNLVFIKIYHL